MTKWQRAVKGEIERWRFMMETTVEWPQFNIRNTICCQIRRVYTCCKRGGGMSSCPLANYGIQRKGFISCVGDFPLFTNIPYFLCGESAIPDSMAILTWLHELATFTEKEIREVSL